MPYIGEPFDASYYIGNRPEGYTDITEIAYWSLIADDIEARLGSVSGLDVLEIGCAYGDLSAELASRGANMVGYDISSHAIGEAQTRHLGITFQQGDAISMPFSNNSFDLVVASEIISCMPDIGTLKDLIREVRRKVKAQGAAYILELLNSIYYFTITEEQWQTEVESLFPGKDVEVLLVGHRLPSDVRIVVT
jgi:ubiquinone/menaquinone biosynthesis C-methylase UbiE